ncbi:hypothetical protein AAG570_009558 [Ranatra chinensis]|uniref:Oxysterol-binding protein n=1 Tax=Ranatra chinensis TaxID=642074 RepID=A0ABD0Z092_9HEMI
MLQRLVEMLEYTSVLDKAAACSDCYERMAYVAAFSISAYSSTASRVLKPFNPLLGETYECDRITDLGWRAITEQVVHHPPVTAIHCESNAGWILSCDLTVQSKFRGKYLQITPIGTIHLLFRDGSCYTYNQVTTTVNNIILGKLWLDQMVEDDAGNVRWTVTGKWDSRVELKKGIEGDEETMIGWERRPLASGSEKYYNFGQFTCQLNEPEMGVSPMDSRLRPDLRLMEEGQWDKADQMKAALEEAQRFRKRARDIGDLPPHNPLWFASKPSALTGQLYWQYKGGYWEAKEKKDWSFCPDIFTPIE